MIAAKQPNSSAVTGHGRPGLCTVPASAAASTSHAVTSMSPAADVAVAPAVVPAMPRSRAIAASTGSAVMDMATPMNNTNEWLMCDWPRAANSDLKIRTAPDPRLMGTRSALAATSTAARRRPDIDRRSSSYPTTNMKITTATWAEDSQGRQHRVREEATGQMTRQAAQEAWAEHDSPQYRSEEHTSELQSLRHLVR